MALDITEELQILKESETPGTGVGPDVNPLLEIIYQASIGEAISFLSTAKDTTGDEPATAYVNKITSLISRINRKDIATLDTMRKIVVSLVGDSTFTFAQVQGADEADWVSLVTGSLLPAEVSPTLLFERAAGVLPAEKNAYDAL